MDMKRILVVDDSIAVRETLTLILGSEFMVVQRPLSPMEVLPQSDEPVDLLIFGVSPAWISHSSNLLRSAASAPFAVLFLVDSRSMLQSRDPPEANRIDYLAKPFNPYELKEKVGRLLTSPTSWVPPVEPFGARAGRARRYFEFPYVSRAAAGLAQRYALSRLPILVHGELGCGQEDLARGMFEMQRPGASWLALSCPALNDKSLFGGLGCLVADRVETGLEPTIFLNGVESLDPWAQASLLRVLEEEEYRGRDLWVLSTAHEDLLERVYRGDFLGSLYYRLATLTLFLAPLRDRRDEIPGLAAALAQDYGERLGLGPVRLSPDAMARLCNYLWFGNAREMETVIARTVAARRKTFLEADDFLFGSGEDLRWGLPLGADQEPGKEEKQDFFKEEKVKKGPPSAVLRNGNALDLSVVVNELAHELKNPMVTIKTFSQLLAERYDDPVFRNRFREMVSGDIERMDALLESLLDFARLGQPAAQSVSLLEQLRQVLEEVLPDPRKEWIKEELRRLGQDTEVFVDQEHLRYALKNVLRSALFEAKPRGDVDIHTEAEGVIAVSYLQEGGRVVSLAQYLDPNAQPTDSDHEGMSLRVLLAKTLLEKSGGKVKMERDDAGNVRIRMQLPTVQSRTRAL
ncbi:MAG: ATP-binding response regulator [Candidatus Binatia bacterium]